ncbi:DHH family phosphoesterase [Actinokineospora diospyrosa]|uniref:Phosphoesterase RecJ domain-containing protein n=1 Tax=Actinokineospora diospyrosa TaxID=103728 RepID=A0ABT1IJI1_9PSEU|nr:DHH family phosphoesterase [Actinokineospora diospyrosa]MCP2272813.1 phosphoesterase RecJ domain-containing protein [Actinokineospora diospyrosa]
MGTDLAADLAAAADLLRTATDVTLLAHVSPDADALGSALALGLALHARGAVVRVSFGFPTEVPRSLRGLDPIGLVVPAPAVPAAPSLLVALDCASEQRLGQLVDRVPATIAAGGRVLVVDHHVANTRFGTDHLIDETAPATVVLVLALLDELGAELTPQIAKCLYAGLIGDTGSFRRATPDTHATAGRLIAAGADPTEVARQLMDSHPFGWLRMVSSVLARAQLVPDAVDGRGLVLTVVSLTDLAGLEPEDADSVVDLVRTVEGAEVAAVAKEITPGHWSVSLRAVGSADVRAVAASLGGGGHRLAAGFPARGSAEDVLVLIKNAFA